MIHPGKNVGMPMRRPDWENHCLRYWFKEMVRGSTRSDSTWEYQLLAICPASGRLMYMGEYHPIAWNIIERDRLFEKEVYEAYEFYLIDKVLS